MYKDPVYANLDLAYFPLEAPTDSVATAGH